MIEKEIFFFRKKFIVADLVTLRQTINGFLQLLHQTREKEHIAFSKDKLEVHRKNGNFSKLHRLSYIVVCFLQNNTLLDEINVENFSLFLKKK